MNYIFLNSQSSEFSIYDLHLTRCIARVCCKSARHWLTAFPLATPHRQQMGAESATAIGTYDSCCVSDACRR